MIRKLEFRAMGSKILVAVDSADEQALEAAHQVPIWFEQWEGVFSRFRPESELSRLNRSNGKPFTPSKDMKEVLQLAKQMQARTGGTVTPLVLDALVGCGYDIDFGVLDKGSHLVELKGLPPLPSMIDFELDGNFVLLPEGAHIDLGGFAKGWAAQQAMERLARLSACLVNAGGDIAISRSQADGKPWLIGVEDPLTPGQNVGLLEISGKGVATSGKDYRSWLTDGRVMHHLIDPWTGMPAVSDVYSATVIASDVMFAEAASKTAVILGSERGRAWLDEQPGTAYLLQLESGEVIFNSLFQSALWSADEAKHQ